MNELVIARGEKGAAQAAPFLRYLRRAVREPFLHFLLLGALLFSVNEYLEQRSKFTHISITPKVVAGIATNYRLQYGVLPTPNQLESLVESYVREEVFYHEALKLGLDRDDEIIRRRLVQKYEFLQQDLDVAQEPDEATLRAYFNAHSRAYELPALTSFTHVYFSTDARGEEGARADAARLAASLNTRDVTRAPDEGDRFPGPTDFASASQDEAGRVFGRDGLAAEITTIEPHHWTGPIRSGLGWHLVYVSSRQAPKQQSYEAAHDAVYRDYMDEVRGKRNAQAYAELRKRFVIEREE